MVPSRTFQGGFNIPYPDQKTALDQLYQDQSHLEKEIKTISDQRMLAMEKQIELLSKMSVSCKELSTDRIFEAH